MPPAARALPAAPASPPERPGPSARPRGTAGRGRRLPGEAETGRRADLPPRPGRPGRAGTVRLTETSAWPAVGLAHALRCLGYEPRNGRAAARLRPSRRGGAVGRPGGRPGRLIAGASLPGPLRTGPRGQPRGPRPGGEPHVGAGPAVRESDGLEPSSAWPRSGNGSTRHPPPDPARNSTSATASGSRTTRRWPARSPTSWSRSRTWPALAGAGTRSGAARRRAGQREGDGRPHAFWAENAFHLPQMLAVRWLASGPGTSKGGGRTGETVDLALPFVRPAVLLCRDGPQTPGSPSTTWRAPPGASPDWDRPTFLGPAAPARRRGAGPGGARSPDRPGAEGPDPGAPKALCSARPTSSAWCARRRKPSAAVGSSSSRPSVVTCWPSGRPRRRGPPSNTSCSSSPTSRSSPIARA